MSEKCPSYSMVAIICQGTRFYCNLKKGHQGLHKHQLSWGGDGND